MCLLHNPNFEKKPLCIVYFIEYLFHVLTSIINSFEDSGIGILTIIRSLRMLAVKKRGGIFIVTQFEAINVNRYYPS